MADKKESDHKSEGPDKIALEDLLTQVEKSRPLDVLLHDVMQDELAKQFHAKEEAKQQIIKELVSASKIYEKMPLERLAIKLGQDTNEILDLLEEIILKHEFSGIVISGNELIFTKIQKRNELDQKPVHQMSPKPNLVPAIEPKVQPIRRKHVDLKFKVLEDTGTTQAAQPAVEEGPISISAQLAPVTAHVQYRLVLTNTSTKTINNITIRFLIQGNVSLARMKPNYITPDWNSEITVPSIAAETSRRLLLYFSPASCGIVEVATVVEYQDANGVFMGDTVTEKINLTNPDFIARENPINEDQFQDLIHHLQYKGLKSYGLPPNLSPGDAYLIIKEILLVNEFELVGEKLEEDAGKFIGWYYAKIQHPDGSKDDYIVIGQVLNKKMEFFAMSNDEMNLLCGLTMLSGMLLESMVDRGLAKDTRDLIELYCLSCGGTLSRFPEPGTVHECRFCGAKLQF